MISPSEFSVSEKELRERLNLPSSAIVISYGYEKMKDEAAVYVLKTRFDLPSMFIRSSPDYFVIDGRRQYFVESKQKTKYVEAIQLLFNKFYEIMGMNVLYSFPDILINAAMIPMNTVVIPENYRNQFDSNLKHLFVNEGVTDFRYIGHVSNGSGDAFVPVEAEELEFLSEGAIVH